MEDRLKTIVVSAAASLALVAAASGVAFAQTDAPAAPEVQTACAASPPPPALPTAKLTTKVVKETNASIEGWQAQVQEGIECRKAEIATLNERINGMIDYANAAKSAARTVMEGKPAPTMPATPESKCQAFPAIDAIPPASDVPARNAYVAEVEKAFACRGAEVKELGTQRSAMVAASNAQVQAANEYVGQWVAKVEAFNAAEAAKAANKKKKK
jgi:hypothetical protein